MGNYVYKPGDKIEFTEDYEGYKVGDVFEVLEHEIGRHTNGVVFRNANGNKDYCFTRRVRPYVEPTPEPTFKVGDKVFVDYSDFFEPGRVYTIVKIAAVAYFAETGCVSVLSRLTHANVDETQFKVGLQGGSNVKEITDKLNELDAQIGAALSIVQNAGVKAEQLRRMIAESIVVEPAEVTHTATRKDAVNAAKDYVNSTLDSDGDVLFTHNWCTPQFIVNEKKRTVVVILRGFASGNIYAKAVAKCAPGDVFNAHIGKAIALARVIKEKVPAELINAPQPERAEVGMIVASKIDGERYELTARAPELDGVFGYGRAFHHDHSRNWVGENQVTIISDTDVEY